MPMVKLLRKKRVNKMVIFMPMSACAWGEGESPPAISIFLWLCHSQLAFAFWKSGPNFSLALFSPHLICHFLMRHFLAKCSFFYSACSPRSCRSGGLTKTGPLATGRKIQKLVQQTFREEYQTNSRVSWNRHSGSTIIWWCDVCCV